MSFICFQGYLVLNKPISITTSIINYMNGKSKLLNNQ